MDWILPIGLGLVLFAARDSLGLAAFQVRALRLAYCASLLVAGGSLGAIAEQLSLTDARALVGEPFVWGPAIAVHGLLWLLFESAKRNRRLLAWSRWLLVLPPPLLMYAVGAATWHALRWANLPGPLAGACVMAGYGAVVFVVAFALRRRAASQPAAGTALGFLAASNISGLLLPLLPHRTQPGRALPGNVDWAQSLPVLGIVVSLVSASFLWARLRNSY